MMSLKSISRTVAITLLILVVVGCSSTEDRPTPESPTEQVASEAFSGPANVTSIDIQQVDAFPVEVNVTAKGILGDDCTVIEDIHQSRRGSTIELTITASRPAGLLCRSMQIPFEEKIPVNTIGLPAGIFVVDVNGLQGTFTLQKDNVPDEANSVIGGLIWLDTCNLDDDGNVTDTSAGGGCVITRGGGYTANGVRDPGEPGLNEVVVNLGSGSCPSTGLATTLTDLEGSYLFSGLKAGAYCVSIDSFSEQNMDQMGLGEWTFPLNESPGQSTVVLGTADSNLEIHFGWFVHQDGEVEIVGNDCLDSAAFVSDVTVADDTEFAPGETFTKTWELENTGTCAWGTEYSIVLVEGARFGGPETVPIPEEVAPGETVEISVPLVAPADPGQYRSEWKLRNATGLLFGLGQDADVAFWLQFVVEES